MDNLFTISASRESKSKWCTGKDSNLRTSLGGTDLQSVGFNHSPTCAKLSGDAAVAPSADHSRKAAGKHHANLQAKRSTRYASLAKQGNQGSRKTPRRTLITARRKSTEWSALEKPVAPLPSPPSAGTASLHSLELAKGFEPLTL